jgi:hypothetical protein
MAIKINLLLDTRTCKKCGRTGRQMITQPPPCRKCRTEYMSVYSQTPARKEQRRAVLEAAKMDPDAMALAAARSRKHILFRKYGLTVEKYDAMHEAQQYRCAICGHRPEADQLRLRVDHNHETGTVRALLCVTCNSLIGFAKEDPEILRSALNYLAKHAKL